MTAETMAKALGGRKVGQGWTARCPAHDDREPSLSIRDAAGALSCRVRPTGRDRGPEGTRTVGRQRALVPPETESSKGVVAATRSEPSGTKCCRAFDMAVHDPCRRHAGRSLSRFAWPDLFAAAVIALSFGS